MTSTTKKIIAGLFIVLNFQALSQKPKSAESRTYQFIFFSEDAKNLFSQNQEKITITDSIFLIKIEQLRHPAKVVYAKFSAMTIVKIMPQNNVVNGFFYSEKTIIELNKVEQENILNQAIDVGD